MLDRGPFDPTLAAGLLAAYRGFEEEKPASDFWRHDAARELFLARTALRHGVLAGAVQERLEALAQHVPATPELEAEIGYALLLQGRTEAACERLSVLSPSERSRPEVAFYAAAIRRAEEATPPDASLLAARGPAAPKSR